ncbi:hypothetical protein KAK07_23880 [Ideonella sp. 4Y16]|uniref:hypothetical protein n=1 Tax=Ideonella alba TaxID=2824118 RepID=UPI001B38A988|nr:hypothetical protein [Ideonella alba]MBQ0946397.1 hypothetical protein [Ideonella alba]
MSKLSLTRVLPSIEGSGRLVLTTGFVLLVALLFAFDATAASNKGTALQAAYNSLDDMANGYGKQILTLMGFVIAAIGYIATNASGVVMKFIGYAIFLGAALSAAVTLVGAVI